MNIVYLISQIVGFIAFVISLVAYHRKKKDALLLAVKNGLLELKTKEKSLLEQFELCSGQDIFQREAYVK